MNIFKTRRERPRLIDNEIDRQSCSIRLLEARIYRNSYVDLVLQDGKLDHRGSREEDGATRERQGNALSEHRRERLEAERWGGFS